MKKAGKITIAAVIAAAAAGSGIFGYRAYQAYGYKMAAKSVDEEIAGIGDITADNFDEAAAKVDKAEKDYAALTGKEKPYVTKADELKAKSKERDDMYETVSAAETVMTCIDGIGDVTLDSADYVSQARKDYDALSDESKALVTNLDTLTGAETKIAALAEEKAEAEAKAAAEAEAAETAKKQEEAGKAKAAEAAKADTKAGQAQDATVSTDDPTAPSATGQESAQEPAGQQAPAGTTMWQFRITDKATGELVYKSGFDYADEDSLWKASDEWVSAHPGSYDIDGRGVTVY